MVLFRYDKLQKRGKKLFRFSLRQFKRSLFKPAEMVKEEFLPTLNAKTADRLFQKKDAEINAENAARAAASQSKPSALTPSQNLYQSQLLVLSRAFPETVKLLLNQNGVTPKSVYEAYQRDLFRTTGKMDEPLTFNQEQFENAIKTINNKRRREKSGIDPIEYELVVGWFYRGYANMTPSARTEALKNRGLSPPTGEAIRKMCKRLRLPPIRKPGAHQQ